MNLEDLRKYCLSLPHVMEDVKWEHNLCFLIGEKMFCVTGFEQPLKISIKVSDEDFAELTQTGDIIPAPYLARHKWILIENAGRFKMKEWEDYIRKSYELIKEKLPAGVKKKLF